MAETTIVFDAADDYERYMGPWSRALGERFLAWLAAPSQADWLDVGCGTGAFSELILQRGGPRSLTGIDPSPEQITYVQRRLRGHRFQVGDAAAIPLDRDTVDVVASALVLHFIPDRAAAFAEMARVLRSGGQVAGYTWKRTATEDFAAYAPILRAAERLGSESLHSPVIPEGTLDGMCASLRAAGFVDVEATEIVATRTFETFDDYWTVQTLPFSASGKTVAKLDDRQRARLQHLLRETLVAPDGTITYAAIAIAGKGRKR
jgi:SAM-dependent methyltransferase